MKLEYRILWFDDNEEMFQSIDFDPLTTGIDGWGFIPEIEFVSNPDDFLNKSPFSDYDLLVVDYNLEEHGQGQDFIAKIREQEVYTEVIFYSAGKSSALWEAVGKHQLEGIYIANKNVIIEKILKVGQQTLRKVLDVENMRGIVMAEVGDLDHLLESIVSAAIDGLEQSKRDEVFARFHEHSEESHGKHKEKLDAFKAAPTVEVLLSLCDSNKRWQNFNRAKGHHPKLKGIRLGNYVDDVLTPRNMLAHGVPEKKADGTEVFSYQSKIFEFSEAKGVALRKKIIEYKKAFIAISGQLTEKEVQAVLEQAKAAESGGEATA